MNCQDIARILDEREVDGLLSEEQSNVQAHLATCRDCARDWQIHSQLTRAEIPAVPAELRALYAAQVAGGTNAGARRRGRLVVIGTLMAVAAAAAMLVVELRVPAPPVAAEVGPPPERILTTPESGEGLASPNGDVRAPEVEQTAVKTEQIPVVATVNPKSLRLVLMPTRYDSPEKAANPAIDAFQSSLLQALRAVPDVAVELAGVAASPNDRAANRVTVVSPGFTILPSGQRLYQNGETRNNPSADGSSRRPPLWRVEVVAEPAIPRVTKGNFTLRLEIDSNGIPGGGGCGSSNNGLSITGGPYISFESVCSSADLVAARLVDVLRQHAESQAAGATQFSARLSDTSLSDSARQSALRELFNRARSGEFTLDAAVIDAITAYIGGLPPAERARNWQVLLGARLPGLVSPLLGSLQHDGDEKVRLAALTTLISDYGDDSRVLAALQSVSKQDASRLVRMAAQRPLSGEAEWQSYVAEMLANKGQPPLQRLAPALYGRYFENFSPEAGEKARIFLGSEGVTSQLLDIFKDLEAEVRAAGEDVRDVQPQDDAIGNVVSLLSSTNPAAALDLQIHILESPLPNSSANSFRTFQALRSLLNKRDNPRVEKVLGDIAAGKAGAQLQNTLEQEIAMRQRRPF